MTYRLSLIALALAVMTGCQEPTTQIMSVPDSTVTKKTSTIPPPVRKADDTSLTPIAPVSPSSTTTTVVINQPITLKDVQPSAPVPFIAYQDGTMLNVQTPGAKVADAEFVGWVDTSPGDGRCVMVWSPEVTISNCTFRHGDDDSLGFLGDTHGSLVVDCKFPVLDWRAGWSHALIGYTNAQDGSKPGPFMLEPVSFVRCVFGGGAIRLSSGPWDFHDDDVWISALYGMDVTDVKMNLRGIRFHWSAAKPDAAGYWYQRSSTGQYDPCGVRVGGAGTDRSVNLKSRIYVENCELIEHASMDWNSPIISRKPIDATTLCRRIANDADRAAGRTAYSVAGSVPSTCFVKTPLYK